MKRRIPGGCGENSLVKQETERGGQSVSPVIWILLGLVLLGLLAGGNKNGKKASRGKGTPERIDHPHYMDLDEYECSVCGARFREKSMTCPKCGARFEGTKTDGGEFIEEMEIWEDDE